MRIGVIFLRSQDRGKRTKNRARRRLGRRPGISEIARHGKWSDFARIARNFPTF